MSVLHCPMPDELRIRQYETKVQLIKNGVLVAEIPHQAALEVSRAIHQVAKRAETYAQRERIASDQAVLLRAGVPLGLTDDPQVQDEAAKRAAWDQDLRRAMPGGVRSEEHVGTPRVIRHLPVRE